MNDLETIKKYRTNKTLFLVFLALDIVCFILFVILLGIAISKDMFSLLDIEKMLEEIKANIGLFILILLIDLVSDLFIVLTIVFGVMFSKASKQLNGISNG